MATQYKTQQGDTWDIIAFRLFGDELYMDELIEANFVHRKTIVFRSGVVLNVPEIDTEATPVVVNENLPIWLRGEQQ